MKPIDDSFVGSNPSPGIGGRYFIFACGQHNVASQDGARYIMPALYPHLVAAMAEEVFAHEMAGEDPFQIEKSGGVYSRGFSQRPDISRWGY